MTQATTTHEREHMIVNDTGMGTWPGFSAGYSRVRVQVPDLGPDGYLTP